jgi:hypothetical protein
VIASGDLAAFINRVIHRHAHGLALNEVVVDDGQVSFTDGRLEVTLDCVWRRGCIAGTDLAFTASLYGWPAIVDGKLRLTGSTIEFDMDDIDAVVCLVTSALGGPWTVVMYAVILGYLEASDPNSSTLDIPVSEASDPLPGSDKVVAVELASAVMEPDVLTGEGTLALIEDPLRIYAYLRVVERGVPGEAQPVSNADVTLHEIDYPPPGGDDVLDPSGYTEVSTPRFEITEETIYNPKADELLGTATTGDDGRVTFAVISDMLGGSATTTRITENRHTGQTSVLVTNWLVGEALADLAVSVRAGNGTLLAQERLIALNVEHRRFGRFDQPRRRRRPGARDRPASRPAASAHYDDRAGRARARQGRRRRTDRRGRADRRAARRDRPERLGARSAPERGRGRRDRQRRVPHPQHEPAPVTAAVPVDNKRASVRSKGRLRAAAAPPDRRPPARPAFPRRPAPARTPAGADLCPSTGRAIIVKQQHTRCKRPAPFAQRALTNRSG